jgi:uncharacterized iron-regulated membrane protein
LTRSTNLRLRGLWFSIHKWIGLLLAALIIPISLTGSVLVWHHWIDEALNPQRHAATGAPALSPGAYAEAARPALAPGERIAQISYPEHGEGPILVTAARPPQPGAARPVRTNVWLDPSNGRVLDTAPSNGGPVQVMHVLHGSLMVPGWGRTIVGWVGVFMFISCLTGLWLWWPVTGGVRSGFRWRRQNSTNANLHHQAGFWILLPLAMLSFTGLWISFPSVFSGFEANQARTRGAPPDRMRAMRPRPLERTALTADRALAAAAPHAAGPLVTVTWPTDQASSWKIAFAPHGGAATEVEVADATGKATPPRPPRPETLARTMRRWHDGTGMGPIWRVVIFVGGIVPALLAITGIVMWLRSRGWRAAMARRRKAGRLKPQPAE